MPRWFSARLPYLGLALLTIAAGLAVHFGGGALPARLRDVVGDALWAVMLAWWVGAAIPRASLGARGGVALGLCWAVEVSQLYHSPALDALRRRPLGHLVLGSDFDARDLGAYALGVAAALLAEHAARRRSRGVGVRPGAANREDGEPT